MKVTKVVPLRPTPKPRPKNESGTVPNRIANDALRTRNYLTEDEVESLLKVAKKGRHGQRDHLMLLMAFRHGLRVSELTDMRWTDVDFKAGVAQGHSLGHSVHTEALLDVSLGVAVDEHASLRVELEKAGTGLEPVQVLGDLILGDARRSGLPDAGPPARRERGQLKP